MPSRVCCPHLGRYQTTHSLPCHRSVSLRFQRPRLKPPGKHQGQNEVPRSAAKRRRSHSTTHLPPSSGQGRSLRWRQSRCASSAEQSSRRPFESGAARSASRAGRAVDAAAPTGLHQPVQFALAVAPTIISVTTWGDLRLRLPTESGPAVDDLRRLFLQAVELAAPHNAARPVMLALARPHGMRHSHAT